MSAGKSVQPTGFGVTEVMVGLSTIDVTIGMVVSGPVNCPVPRPAPSLTPVKINTAPSEPSAFIVATARSRTPSELKSAVATLVGGSATVTVDTAVVWKPDGIVPKNTATFLLPKFATARSSIPSSLKSPLTPPEVAALGVVPTFANVCPWVNPPAPLLR